MAPMFTTLNLWATSKGGVKNVEAQITLKFKNVVVILQVAISIAF